MGSSFGKVCSKWYGKKDIRIVFMGLDSAGKTTMLYKLKLGEVVTTIPTIGFNVETIKYKNYEFWAWDIGGRGKIRPLWRHYFQNTDGIVFVIDSNDQERLPEMKDEMYQVLSEVELKDAAVLVVANKQDLPNALSVTQIVEKLDLHSLRNRNWFIVPAVATTGDGLYEGLDWLAGAIGKNQAKKSVISAVEDTTASVVKKNNGVYAFVAGLASIKNKLWGTSLPKTEENIVKEGT